MIDNLSQLQRFAKIMALISFAIFVVLFAFGAWQLSQLNQKINKAEDELQRKKEEITKKEERIKALDAEIERKEAAIKVRDTEIGGILQKTPQVTTTLPRIYLHIKEESQREEAKKLVNLLQVEGYIVPGIENVGDNAGKEIGVRYCENSGLLSDVQRIRELLARENIEVTNTQELRVKNIPGCASVSTKRRYELWLGSDFKINK